jgi:hypothetical protein
VNYPGVVRDQSRHIVFSRRTRGEDASFRSIGSSTLRRTHQYAELDIDTEPSNTFRFSSTEYARPENDTRNGRYQNTCDVHLGIREDVSPRDKDGILASSNAMTNDLSIGIEICRLNCSALLFKVKIPTEQICSYRSVVS